VVHVSRHDRAATSCSYGDRFPQVKARGAVSLPKFVSQPGRLCSTGSEAKSLVTRRQRSYAALRLPCCFDQRSGFPSSLVYHGANAGCEPARRAFADARRVGGIGVRGLRQPRPNRGQPGVSQVTGSSSSNVPRSTTPPRETPPRPLAVTLPAAFRVAEPLGFPERGRFRGCYHAAHLLVCLRINRPITGATARLTTDLPGWALVGRDSHPQDDKPNFMKSSHDSLLSDQHCLVATSDLPTAAAMCLLCSSCMTCEQGQRLSTDRPKRLGARRFIAAFLFSWSPQCPENFLAYECSGSP